MLEKPNLPDEKITDHIRSEFGLTVESLEFLPIGADADTAVYRAITNETLYFVKLRGGDFDEMTIVVPHFLETHGISQLIAPIPTNDGHLWTSLDRFAVILSPFVSAQDGFSVEMSDEQWVELGRALKRIHHAELPYEVAARLPHETYSDQWRDKVREYQQMLDGTFPDVVSAQLAELMRDRRDVIDELLRRAEQLAGEMRSRSSAFVLCHGDLHGGNILIDAQGALFIVDWDTLILAPKERDLMFIGAGIGKGWDDPRGIEHFYQGYGADEIDSIGIAYYRYERIVEDIAAYCEEILESDPSSQDRLVGLNRLSRQFLSNDVIDIAFRTDRTSLFD
ncbi:MAG: aminoglycoside phosphotransferase family protein [Nitrolancea sp.]